MHYCPGRHTSYFAPLLPPQDEPTSGLDSFTALNLMRTMKQVGRGWQARSREGHLPCCTGMCNRVGRAAERSCCRWGS